MDIQKKRPGAKSCGLFSQFTPGGSLDSLPGQRSEKNKQENTESTEHVD